MDASKIASFAVVGGSTTAAEVPKLAAFAVVGGQVEPIDWPDDETDTIELFTFTVSGTDLAWRYSTHLEPITRGSLTYLPEAITRSNVTRAINQPSSDLTIEVGDENEFALRLFDGLTSRPVDVLVEQWQYGALSAVTVFTGRTTGVSFDGPKATIACVPRHAVASRRKVPWQTFQAGCNWQWGSEGCGIDREVYVLGPYGLSTGAWSGVTVTLPSTHADGDLSNGWIERMVDGDRRFIEQNVGGVLTLQSPFPAVTDGESWLVYPGCRRTETDCATRYNNLVNFLGWSRLPAVNPFSRGAFYLQAAAPVVPPAGTTADLGGGYTLDLSPVTAALRVAGSYSGYRRTDVAIRFVEQGQAVLESIGSATLVSAPFVNRYISPRPCPPAVTSGLEIWFSSTGLAVGSIGDRISVALVSGFDAWLPLSSMQQAVVAIGTQGNGSGGNQGVVATATQIHIRVRRASTGLVLVEGDFSMNFSAMVGKPSGAA